MPAQNLWRVDIVNRESDDSTWDSIRSLVRLIHIDSGSALRYSGRQLPSWGFHQHEVVADKVITHQDTIWNVEEHRYTKGKLFEPSSTASFYTLFQASLFLASF